MTCLSELTCAVYVDGELSPEETRTTERHLAECLRCQALVAALRDESRVLSAALGELPALAPSSATAVRRASIPDPAGAMTNGRRAGVRGLTLAGLAAVAGLAGLAGWADLPGRPTGDWIGLVVDTVLFVMMNAATLERTLVTLAVATMAGLGLAGGLYLARPPSGVVAALALVLGTAAGVGPSPAEALETRSGMEVAIGAGETLDGTLVAAAETVRVDGTVLGDLIVAAAHVDVRGTVRGDLVVVAGTVEVAGTIEGSVYAAAGSLTLRGRVGRGLYAADRATVIESGARVGGDLTLAGRSLSLRGEVGRGATILAHEAEVSGHVGRDVRFRGDRLAVRAPARVEGTVRADVSRASALTVDDRATVTGPVLTRVASRAAGWYGEPRVWFWTATSFFGAALLGWVALLLVPGLLVESADGVRRWGRSLGWGAATLVGGPVVIVLLAVTLVGLPLALILLGLYLLGLYAGKIVVGLALGRALLRPRGNARRDALRALVVGLALVTLGTALPLVGGPIWIAVASLGAGALAWRLARAAGAVRSSGA
jgi:cytoskeletal protein CcmA (bactofilin family)